MAVHEARVKFLAVATLQNLDVKFVNYSSIAGGAAFGIEFSGDRSFADFRRGGGLGFSWRGVLADATHQAGLRSTAGWRTSLPATM